LKFITGNSRLTPDEKITISEDCEDSDEYGYESERESENENKDVDKKFPVGHTCGNSMDLPSYSNAATMKDRLLTAIQTCGEIDADGSDYGDYGNDNYGGEDGGSDSSDNTSAGIRRGSIIDSQNTYRFYHDYDEEDYGNEGEESEGEGEETESEDDEDEESEDEDDEGEESESEDEDGEEGEEG